LEISNKELKRKIEESTTIINELIKGVHLLTEQIENLGQQPSWNREGG